MNAEVFVRGLRERGYKISYYQGPPTTLLGRIDRDDPMFEPLQRYGVEMRPYQREPGAVSYEAQLHRARVDEVSEDDPDAGPIAIWEAASGRPVTIPA